MTGLEKMGAGDFAGSIAALEAALSAEPDNLDVMLGLSMAHSKAGDQDKAIEVAKVAVERHPDDPFPHTNLSMFLQKQGKIEEAETEAALATKLSMKA